MSNKNQRKERNQKVDQKVTKLNTYRARSKAPLK